MQDRRLLQDLSAGCIQHRPAHGRSSPYTQRVRPTDRQLSRQEVVGYRFSGPRGRVHVTESRNPDDRAWTYPTVETNRSPSCFLDGQEQTLQGKSRKFALDGQRNAVTSISLHANRCQRDFDRRRAVILHTIM